MKKISVFILMVSIACLTTACYAGTPLEKLGRGVSNIVTSPFEIFYRIGKANDEKGPFAGFSWGLLDGLFRMGMRAVVGVYEVVTFPIPLPDGYNPIITDPEYFCQEGIY